MSVVSAYRPAYRPMDRIGRRVPGKSHPRDSDPGASRSVSLWHPTENRADAGFASRAEWYRHDGMAP
jgi:hypothetical protein